MTDVMAAHGRIDGVAGRIAASICDEEGKPVFTPADITGEADPERGALDGQLTIALLLAIQEVNDLGKTSLPEKTKSGVSSSSTASVAGPSPKRKKRSASASSSSGSNTATSTEA